MQEFFSMSGLFLSSLLWTGLTVAGEATATAPSVARDAEKPEDFFTLIVLPDTQGYADTRHRETQKHWPDIGDQRDCFFAQTEWIKDNRRKRNIVLAAHVGDITQTEHDDEWKIADSAFKTIEPHVPYVLCSGNHDMGYSPDLRKTGQSRASRFSTYFPPARFTGNPFYDSHFGMEKHLHFREEGKTENYYLYFRAGGMKFLMLALEFKPRDEALAWANRVAEQHPDHRIIVVTHGYLTKKGRRAESDGYPIKGSSGQAIWEKFVSRHKNIFLVLSGHAGESRLTSEGRHGNTVHQIQSDYWYWDLPRIKAGSGFLRILTFRPGQDRIDVETYSPVLDEFLDRPSSKFSLPFAMEDQAAQVTQAKLPALEGPTPDVSREIDMPLVDLSADDDPLKIINWNVLYRFNHHRSIEEAGKWIVGQQPNIIAFQELNGISGKRLGELAMRWGHAHAVTHKESGFPVGLTSKEPIEVIERQSRGYHHGFLHCKTYGIHFFVVHFWPGKSEEVDRILERIAPLLERKEKVVILGDFNGCSRKDEAFLVENAKLRKRDYTFVDKVEAKGFVDIVHKHDPDAKVSCPSPITIPRWSKDMEELKLKRYRIDFVFADASLAEDSLSGTISLAREIDAISDHYPVIVEFKIPE